MSNMTLDLESSIQFYSGNLTFKSNYTNNV